MSIFHAELERYLQLRQEDLSCNSFFVIKNRLFNFNNFLAAKEHREKNIPEKLVNEWIFAIRLTHAQRTTNDWISHLRGFLQFLRYEGYEVYIPNCPRTPDLYVPYIFSDSELEKIFSAADNLHTRYLPGHKQNPHIRFEIPMLLRLLYGCGLRLGEALSLRMENVNLRQGTLYLWETKNEKHRIVPMEHSLAEILQKYCCAMKLTEKPDAPLFPGSNMDLPMSQSTARNCFLRILIETEIYIQPKPHARGQCLHCFRHLFAIKSFAQAEHFGRSPDASVPYLSVYLGHRDLDETEKYLKFSSDMFPEHKALFESYAAEVFAEVSL